MIKRLALVMALMAGGCPAFAAGTVPGISMTQQLDELGKPLSGGKLYLIQAGTTATPQNCYQDSGLTIAYPNPITLDSAGRAPQIFCADGSIKIRLTDKNGNQKLVQDGLLIVGPSGGGGGGSTVDATTILQPCDVKVVYGTGVITGFVRANGRTIGNAVSGATERANADTQALFTCLYNNDTTLAVSGGRGASAAADYAANKTLTLPDARGRTLAGLDDMGNTAAGRLTSSFFGGTPTALGASGGSQTQVLATANLPPYTPAGTIAPIVDSNRSDVQVNSTLGTASFNPPGGSVAVPIANTVVLRSTGAGTFTGTAQGGTSSAFSVMPPTLLVTTYLKL